MNFKFRLLSLFELDTKECVHLYQLLCMHAGTGKSETGAHLAYVFARHNKVLNRSQVNYKCVLYCGPSNKSVDVVLRE